LSSPLWKKQNPKKRFSPFKKSASTFARARYPLAKLQLGLFEGPQLASVFALDAIPLRGRNMSKIMNSLPVVDVSGLTSSSLVERKAVAVEMGHACREIGFFHVSNHGIPEAMCDGVFSAAREFFSLPLESKKRLSCTLSPHRTAAISRWKTSA
jgi:hypothetical protein